MIVHGLQTQVEMPGEGITGFNVNITATITTEDELRAELYAAVDSAILLMRTMNTVPKHSKNLLKG